MISYILAWWAVFWLPVRKRVFSALAFIPAAFCSLGIPTLVADILLGSPRRFLIFWSIAPFVVLIAELLWRIKKENPNKEP